MVNIIVAFPKKENAGRIQSILVKGGFPVSAVCTSGAQTLQYANDFSDGIVVCGSKFCDMVYQELYQDLPPHFEMLLLAPPELCSRKEGDIVSLSMPLKVHELLETVRMMEYQISRRRQRSGRGRQRSEEEQALIKQAKALLMERNHMTEEEAHRYLQKCSMDSGTGLSETAQMILSIM